MTLRVTQHGISESGPSLETFTRDERGRWKKSGVGGMGEFDTLVEYEMSAADDRGATFAGFTYRLVPACSSSEKITHTCTDGHPRSCQRCTKVALQRHTDDPQPSFSTGSGSSGRRESKPVDCTQACPVDEWTPRLPGLTAALAGRRFFGSLGEEPTIFRAAKDCARERRRLARPRRP